MGQEPNTELREFLRARRARLTPESVGLPPYPGLRRVAGLRREEVAQLAGVSVDYYVRLERGRVPNASETVIEAVARALCLNDLERAHLLALVKPARSRSRPAASQRLRPGLQLVLDSLTDVPALVLGRRLDVLASNALCRAFYTDFDALPPGSRNMVRLIFLDEPMRLLYQDWPAAARGVVAALHLYAGRHPDDPALAELVGELSVHDRDFRRWWADHDIDQRTHGVKHYRHPLVGELVLGYEAFTPVDDPDQTLGISVVQPGSPSAERLRLLASWTEPSPSRRSPG